MIIMHFQKLDKKDKKRYNAIILNHEVYHLYIVSITLKKDKREILVTNRIVSRFLAQKQRRNKWNNIKMSTLIRK